MLSIFILIKNLITNRKTTSSHPTQKTYKYTPKPWWSSMKLTTSNHTDCRQPIFFSFCNFSFFLYIVKRIEFTCIYVFHSSSLFSPQTYLLQLEYLYRQIFPYQAFFSPENYFTFRCLFPDSFYRAFSISEYFFIVNICYR